MHTYFFTDIGTVKSVDGVSFDVPQGKTVGIVGESGCGKSVTSLSLMQLVQRPSGQTVEGEINYLFVWIPAGLLILLTVLAFNFIGDGLRDAFDPKMKR